MSHVCYSVEAELKQETSRNQAVASSNQALGSASRDLDKKSEAKRNYLDKVRK